MRWNPELYEKFAGPRLQPGLDLIARMAPPTDNGPIVDLGCGTGTLTDALGQAFNASDRLVGIDHSPEMLAKARGRYPTIAWREGDVSDWQSDRPAAALFSNAVLHWLDDHEALFGRLLDQLAPGGTLAVQMPRNYDAPSYRLLGELANAPSWRGKAVPLRRPVAEPEAYYRLLAPMARQVDIWQTAYLQVLEGTDAVFTYSKSTMLQQVIAGMAAEDEARFCNEYRARLAEAYPPEPDGRTLFSFNRLFIVAQR